MMTKGNEKTVAVLMSVYKNDSPEHLELAIKSIIKQSLKNDLYIFEDGPIPKSLKDVLSRYSDRDDIHIISSHVNLGLAGALNKLIEFTLPRGYDFFARMDSDDIARRNRLEKQVRHLVDNSEVDVCGTSCKEFGANFSLEVKSLPTSHEELKSFSVSRCPFIHPTVVFRRSVFIDGNRYPLDTNLTEDMALWFELLQRGYKFSNIDDVLLDYRLNENTISRRRGFKKALSEVRIRFRYMFLLGEVTPKNIVLVSSRLVFHILPKNALKILYKHAR